MNYKKSYVSKSVLELDDFEEPPPLHGKPCLSPIAVTTLIFHDISEKCLIFRERFFPEAPLHDWNDWRWQIRNSITSFDVPGKIMNLSAEEVGFTII